MRVTTRLVVDLESGRILERDFYDYDGPVALCARGQSQAADTQRQQTNAIGAGQLGQAQSLEAGLIPDYQSMLNEGFTPTEKSAMTTAGMGAVGSSFGSAQEEAANSAAKTNNASNLTAQQDQLAMSKGLAEGQTAAGLQQQFANQEQQNRQAGLAGLSGLYGENMKGMESMYGLSPSLLQARAAGPGWAQGVESFGKGIGAMLSPFSGRLGGNSSGGGNNGGNG